MTYTVKIKKTMGTTEIIIETIVENKDEVSIKLKELHKITQSSIKELFPASKEPNMPKFLPSMGAPGLRV